MPDGVQHDAFRRETMVVAQNLRRYRYRVGGVYIWQGLAGTGRNVWW